MDNWLNLENKVIIVTGGSAGIGFQTVCELINDGAYVVIADINPPKKEIKTTKENQYIYVKTDVSNKDDVINMVKQTIETYKTIDVLVNNAGVIVPKLLVSDNKKYELDSASWDRVMNINLKGTFYCSQEVARIMVKNKSGVIINMSSECGLEGSEGQSVYAASKGAINALTRSWCKELGKYNVRVVGLAPGIIEATDLRTEEYEEGLAFTRGITKEELRKGYEKANITPLGRCGKLTEVAQAVAFLASDKSSYIHGTTINVAGGKTRG